MLVRVVAFDNYHVDCKWRASYICLGFLVLSVTKLSDIRYL